MYADDTLVVTSSSEMLLDNVCTWCNEDNLTINIDEAMFRCINPSNKEATISNHILQIC